MRGEYDEEATWIQANPELPPRARRILTIGQTDRVTVGTTSACAENTNTNASSAWGKWNYLRVRGEYLNKTFCGAGHWELPPRARRIPYIGLPHHGHGGTTSACAENTFLPALHARTLRNYLRMRGEYRAAITVRSATSELPPRARRIRGETFWAQSNGGTTSACAENTPSLMRLSYGNGNYLRVRGEYMLPQAAGGDHMELPPRARRIPHTRHSPGAAIGTTSACAENTPTETKKD